MKPTMKNLLNTALALPTEDRVEFLEAPIASLYPEDRPPFDESWREVIQQRSLTIVARTAAASNPRRQSH
jgi:hypothetical protein